MSTIQSYIHEALQELHQVRWPTRQQAIRLSIIVIGFTAVSSAAFGLMDYGLNELLKLIFQFLI